MEFLTTGAISNAIAFIALAISGLSYRQAKAANAVKAPRIEVTVHDSYPWESWRRVKLRIASEESGTFEILGLRTRWFERAAMCLDRKIKRDVVFTHHTNRYLGNTIQRKSLEFPKEPPHDMCGPSIDSMQVRIPPERDRMTNIDVAVAGKLPRAMIVRYKRLDDQKCRSMKVPMP